MQTFAQLYQRALAFEFLSAEEGRYLFEHAPLTELMAVANEMRKKQVPHGKVTWQIDRNVNTTNVCVANCKFCNFYRVPGHAEGGEITLFKSVGMSLEDLAAAIAVWENRTPL